MLGDTAPQVTWVTWPRKGDMIEICMYVCLALVMASLFDLKK